MRILLLLLLSLPVQAEHLWTGHWPKLSTKLYGQTILLSAFYLPVINKTDERWQPYVTQSLADWSQSRHTYLYELPGKKDYKGFCVPRLGAAVICNDEYGQNGWLGIAGIYVYGGHIQFGYVKLNDSYLWDGYHASPDWRQSIVCQEVGHVLGLEHQDEDFENEPLFSCMDYQDPPYPSPNGHDFEQLEEIYSHVDAYRVVGTDEVTEGLGLSVRKDDNSETFLRITPEGGKHITQVTYAE